MPQLYSNQRTRGTDLSGSLEGAGGIGGLLGRSHGYSGGNWSTHNFYHADGNGNITYLVNSSQTVAASYRYDAYGNTLSSSGSLASANTYRFSSKMADDLSGGLYYYGYRWYVPNLQRWLNRDPIQENGGINLYGFAGRNPISLVDPTGLEYYDYIPVIGTIACWFGHEDGDRTGDYGSVPMPNCRGCKDDDYQIGIVETKCETAINNMMLKYQGKLVAPGVVKYGTDGISLMVSFIPGVGWVWGGVGAVDAVVGGSCTITRLNDIGNAAREAKKWCKCPQKKRNKL